MMSPSRAKGDGNGGDAAKGKGHRRESRDLRERFEKAERNDKPEKSDKEDKRLVCVEPFDSRF